MYALRRSSAIPVIIVPNFHLIWFQSDRSGVDISRSKGVTDTARLLWQGRETLDRIQIIKNSGISKVHKPQNTADEGNSPMQSVSPVTLFHLPPC